MFDEDKEIGKRRLARHVYEERIVDPVSGREYISESIRDVVENWDGTIEIRLVRPGELLACGHPYVAGQMRTVCGACSKKAGELKFVCEKCQVTCAYCGANVCQRHSVPGKDGRRYCSKKCVKASAALNSSTPKHSFIWRLIGWI